MFATQVKPIYWYCYFSETLIFSKTNNKGRKNTTSSTLRKGERKYMSKSHSMMVCKEAPQRTVQSADPGWDPQIWLLGVCAVMDVGVHSPDGLSYSPDPVQSSGSASTAAQHTADGPTHSLTLLFSCLEERPRRCIRPESIFFPFIRASLSSGLRDVVLFILLSIFHFQLCFRVQTNAPVPPLHFDNLSEAGGCFMISPR